ncbi:MAG: helix-turn-helix transcriptional regulator [Acidobacteria bacterium]|nr:helix-turn-helix transcriptional regulator [Acidobacteriota bacterium]
MEAKQIEWQIQQPNYSLSYSNLTREPTIEQISFYYTIYYLLSGSLEISFNNIFQLIEKQKIILLTPTKPYLIQNGRGILFSIKIKPDLINELATKLAMDWRVGEVFFVEQITNSKEINKICQQLIYEATNQLTGYKIVLDTLITQLTVELLRNWLRIRHNPQLELSRVGLVDRRLRRAIEYMHINYNKELILSEIAQAAFLSEYHFAHLFKKLTGMTPNNYLIAIRIEQAKKFLIETDQSMANISLSVGYSSQSHFTKVFRAYTGLTPAKYRERLLNK